MNTIAPHLAMATVLAARHLRLVALSAAPGLAAQAAGGMILIIMALATALMAALASAVRGLVALLSEFLRVAAAMTSFLFTTVIVVVVAAALVVHH